MKLPLGGRM